MLKYHMPCQGKYQQQQQQQQNAYCLRFEWQEEEAAVVAAAADDTKLWLDIGYAMGCLSVCLSTRHCMACYRPM